MSQSQVMIGALIAGFILWLLMNNGLAKYWALLTGGGATTPATPVSSSTPTTTPGAGSPGATPATPGASSSGGGITINPGPTSSGGSFFTGGQ